MAKSRAVLEAENRLLRRYRIAEGVVTLTRQAISWGGTVWIAYYVFRSIEVLAGKTTAADIGVSFLGDIRISTALAWALASGGVSYGVLQRKQKRDTVERLHPRIAQLEARIDAKRSSSSLTPRGDTNPEDEL